MYSNETWFTTQVDKEKLVAFKKVKFYEKSTDLFEIKMGNMRRKMKNNGNITQAKY